jgi:hypothetical protein
MTDWSPETPTNPNQPTLKFPKTAQNPEKASQSRQLNSEKFMIPSNGCI